MAARRKAASGQQPPVEETLGAELERRLRAEAHPQRAAQVKRYMKSHLRFLGVPVPDVRRVVKQALKQRPDLSRGQLLEAAHALWDTAVFDLRAAAIALLEQKRELLQPGDLRPIEQWLRECGTWTLGARLVRLPDVNVLIYAHREDSTPDHPRYAEWLIALATGPEPFALSVLVLSALVRITTNPRVFRRPSTLDEVFSFITQLVQRPTARIVAPGPDPLPIFERLCREAAASGKLVADAQHAAVAIEHGCTLVTTDSDFDRFQGVRWQHPLRQA